MVKKINIPPPQKRSTHKRWPIMLLLFGAAAFSYLCFYSDLVEKLSPERAAKLQKELEEFDNAEQYVLLATNDGWYPCFPCVEKKLIFLKKGNIWKYGVTRKGEASRYGKSLSDKNLIYFTEYEGTLQECLKQEKIKIYGYAIHPENLARKVPLIRPPGNKQDN
jgi:hypothetical protein